VLGAEARAAAKSESAVRSGTVELEVPRGAVEGDGNVFVLRLRATAPRPASVLSLQQFTAGDAGGEAADVAVTRAITVLVQP
jgi:hypothetical protein